MIINRSCPHCQAVNFTDFKEYLFCQHFQWIKILNEFDVFGEPIYEICWKDDQP